MNFTLSDGTVVSLSELQTMVIEAERARNAKVSFPQQPATKEESCPQ